jgi:hypothetical protein
LVKQANDITDTLEGDGTDVGLIAKTSGLINKVGDENNGLIKEVNDNTALIGDNTSGLIKDLNDTNSLLGNVPTGQTLQGQITTQNSKIGNVPSGQTIQGQINTHTTQIGDVDDVDLQTQINGIKSVIQNNNENQAIWVISTATPSPQEWDILMYDYAVDIDNIHYAYSIQNNKAFIRNKSVWQEYDIEELIEEVDFITGIAYDVRNVVNVTQYEVWDYMLSCLYDVFYVKENNKWVVTEYDYSYARNSVYALTDWLSGSYSNIVVGDNKSQHRINREIDYVLGQKSDSTHTHNTWTQSTLWSSGNNYAILWVNEDIRVCNLKYYRQNVAVTTSEKILNATLIPSTYRPSYSIINACFNPKISLAVTTGGDISCAGSESGTWTVNSNLMWNY